MKRGGIINDRLSHAIAAMGHGDLMMIVDAGFPIPKDAERIDLSIIAGEPSLDLVYRAISAELIVEKIHFAEEVPIHNLPMFETLKRWFDERDFEPVPHESLLGDFACRAKTIVRTGALDPWGNIVLRSGVDYTQYFADPRLDPPEPFRSLIQRSPFRRGA